MSMDPIEVFEQCDTSLVSDALDEHGLDGVITGLAPAGPDHEAVGRARPVRFERASDEGPTNFPYEMLEAMAADEVFVLDAVSPDISCWGGQATALAANAGMAGVVVDGGYRDATEVQAGSVPVFGRATTPRSGQRRVRVASTDAPVTVDGVRVEPGDVVVADATGVVVVPADADDAVAETAAELRDREESLASKVAEGADLEELRADHDSF